MNEYVDKEVITTELLNECLITGYGGLTSHDIKRVMQRQPAVNEKGGLDLRSDTERYLEALVKIEDKKLSVLSEIAWYLRQISGNSRGKNSGKTDEMEDGADNG